MIRIWIAVTAVLLTSICHGLSQSYYEYQFLFNGTSYQTNASGDIVSTPITDQTLLQAQAQQLGVTDLSTISIVYHLDGGPPYGDTVDIISNATGETLTYEFGFFFATDASLGRYFVVNTTQTEQRQVDQLYTFDNTTYTYQNGDSIGTSFTCKRFLVDANGNTNAFVDGLMSWDVTPTVANAGPIVCVGNFTLGQPVQ